MIAVLAVDIWKTTPFMALLILAGLQTVPGDIYEAAKIDGEHPVKVFWKLTLPLIRPALMVAVRAGLYELVRFLGIYNTPWAMIMSYTIFTLPFTVWVLTTFMRDLPAEIEEAAIIDGASPWVIITQVFLPLLWPALVTTGLLAFIGAWNEFLFALTFTISEDQRTTPVAIALLSGASTQEIPWGPIMAASVVVTIPLVVLVLVFQRKIVAGLTAGGVKG